MKIEISKSQWEAMGKKAGWIQDPTLRSKYMDSQKWWESLSINEMKALTKKYYPNCRWSFVSSTPSLVEDIYRKENDFHIL